MRKSATLVLALFYLLQATWLLHAGADLLFSEKRAPVASSACGSCGCPDHESARKTCCCFPHEEHAKTAPAPASTLDEARCRGTQAAMAQGLTQPVVSGFAILERVVPLGSDVLIPEITPHFPPSSELLDKVPIAQA